MKMWLGEGGIRTLGALLGHGALAKLCFQPLSHLTKSSAASENMAENRRRPTLASFSRLIMCDKRGTGLSDRVPNDRLPTLEERMDDLRAVMDAAGSQRAAVFGFSEGGNLSATFAATYPKRTTALIMFGTFAKRIWR